MRWASVFQLFVGFWMLSNKVIFQNFWAIKDTAQDFLLSGHLIGNLKID
jgi:hypothetical protein